MTVLRSTPISPNPTTCPLDADVIIVGGGIVGATLACALAPSGLRIAIVEAKPQSQGLANRRAYAFSITSAKLFDSLGLWNPLQPRITNCPSIRLSDGQHPSILWFTPKDLTDCPSVVHVGEHGVILDVLYQRLATHPNIQWHCPQSVESVEYLADRAIVHLTPLDPHSSGGRMPFAPTTLTTRLIIAADGHQSPLRQAAGIAYRGWPYWQSCIGFTVRTELDHDNIAYERFWPSGPFAILPLPDRRAQVVWTAPHGEAKALAALSEAEFLIELNQRFGGQMGQIQLDTPRTVFPVQLRQSQQYSRHRLALVGDAAHSCHPVGGQGLNMGIRDSIALAQVIREAETLGQDIGQVQVLQRYQRWRQVENLAILGFTDILDRVFSSQWLPIVWVRRLGLQVLIRVPIARRLALGLMTGKLGWLPRLDSDIT